MPEAPPPETQVHCVVTGSNSHKSFSVPPGVPPAAVPTESSPNPPNSQTLPAVSIQSTDSSRPPGTLPAAAVPFVPYNPNELAVCEPATKVHVWLAMSSFHRSFRNPKFPAESYPLPPNIQTVLEAVSVTTEGAQRPPG